MMGWFIYCIYNNKNPWFWWSYKSFFCKWEKR